MNLNELENTRRDLIRQENSLKIEQCLHKSNIDSLKKKIDTNKIILTKLNRSLCEINKKIREAESEKGVRLQVTEHAMVRYLERAEGFNIEKLKAGIVNLLGESLPDGKYPLDGYNLRAVVKDNKVITIEPKHKG